MRVIDAGYVFEDDNGNPLSGGRVYFYTSGTATLKATYADVDRTIQNANPITIAADGRLPVKVFGVGLYTVKVLDTNGALIWSEDDIGSDADSDESTFNIGLTGAVDRTVTEKLSDIISVKDFGATGNGTTNDTAAIQAAINALAGAHGGTVLFPVGTYRITNSLVISNGIMLRGEGSNISTSVIYADGMSTLPAITNTNYGVGVGNSQMAIRDLCIKGSAYGELEQAIALQGFWISIFNVQTINTNGASGAIELLNSAFIGLRDVYMLGHASAGTAGTGYGLVLDGCTDIKAHVDVEGFAEGVRFTGGSHGNTVDARAELCSGVTIEITSCDDNDIIGTFHNCYSRWVSLLGTSRNNRVRIRRGSDTNVPASPVLIDTNTDDNFVDTDEGITSNTNDYQGRHGGLHHLGNSGYTGQAGILRFGNYYVWVEASTGKLRIKSGAPSSDSDGTVVGTQT